MVYDAKPGIDDDVESLAAELSGRRLCLLTGAGISTESGIPDYRGPETARRARNPIKYNQFLGAPAARKRYWARSMVGWPKMSGATPNAAHKALAELEQSSLSVGTITQNVDGLHQRAGSRRVVELHGALAEVRCLDCGYLDDRDAVQARMVEANPGGHQGSVEIAPDGDAELGGDLSDFVEPRCVGCDGTLKPNVVFFGESVPRAIVEQCYSMVEESQALLVVGSSLTVFSGYRFVKRASEREIPVYILNLGPTRGDPHARLRIDQPAGPALARLARELIGAQR